MVLGQYPLNGSIFDIALGLDIILVFSSLEIFITYFYYNSKLKNDINMRNLYWSLIFLGYSLFSILNVLANFYATSEIQHLQFLHFANIAMSVSLNVSLILSRIFEESKIKKKLYLNFSIIAISIVLLFVFQYLIYIISSILLALTIVLSAYYFSKYCLRLLEASKFKKEVSRKVYLLVFSSSLFTVSIILSIDLFKDLFSTDVYLYQAIFGMIALHFYQFNLNKLPDYREFLWRDTLNAVYIVNNGGVLLFGRSYKRDVDFNQEFLIGGGLYSIRTIVNTITSNAKLQKVELEDKVLIFDIYNDIIACAVTTSYNKSIQTQLHLFLREFYDKFKIFIENWSGNMDVFSPAEKLCDEFLMPK